jgi:hypothetical protein
MEPVNHSSRFPEPVWVHPSRWLNAVSERRRTALSAGAIPPEFLYSGYRQSQLWRTVARHHVPPGLDSFYRTTFSRLPSGKWIHLVALGAGGAEKERCLQEKIGARLATALDVSEALAVLSAQQLYPAFPEPPRPVAADLTRFADLPEWLSTFDGDASRLYTAFGLTPNLSPSDLDPILATFLRPGDELLISANLMEEGRIDSILPQYDNPETRAWLNEVLVQWGIAPHLSALTIAFEPLDGACGRILAQTAWRQNITLEWEGGEFHAQAGQPLTVFSSLRYTSEGFAARLRAAGFSLTSQSTSDCGQEGVWQVSRIAGV